MAVKNKTPSAMLAFLILFLYEFYSADFICILGLEQVMTRRQFSYPNAVDLMVEISPDIYLPSQPVNHRYLRSFRKTRHVEVILSGNRIDMNFFRFVLNSSVNDR